MLANELAGRITAEIVEGVATLVIENPARRNAIDAAMWRELDAKLAELADDPGVRVLVLRGSGDLFGNDLVGPSGFESFRMAAAI